VIIIALAVCTFSTFVFSYATHFWLAAAMRALSGFGAAFCLLSVMRLATRWFPTTKLALAIGVVVTMAMIGGMVAQTPVAVLNEYVGWRKMVRIDSGMGLIFIAIIFWQVRDFPLHSTLKMQTQKMLHNVSFWHSVFSVWKNPQNWLAGCYTSFLNLPILVIGALWGTNYLCQVHHLSMHEATSVSMVLFLGTIIGCPTLGWVSDTLKRRKLPMIICAFIAIVNVLLIMYWPTPSYTIITMLFFSLGFITSAQIISYPLIAESNPNALAGTATGWAAVLIMGGGAVGQPMFGWLLDRDWNGVKVAGVPVYSAADYLYAWRFIPIMFVVALILSLILKETNSKPYSEKQS
jgi:sugar phosphate permease